MGRKHRKNYHRDSEDTRRYRSHHSEGNRHSSHSNHKHTEARNSRKRKHTPPLDTKSDENYNAPSNTKRYKRNRVLSRRGSDPRYTSDIGSASHDYERNRNLSSESNIRSEDTFSELDIDSRTSRWKTNISAFDNPLNFQQTMLVENGHSSSYTAEHGTYTSDPVQNFCNFVSPYTNETFPNVTVSCIPINNPKPKPDDLRNFIEQRKRNKSYMCTEATIPPEHAVPSACWVDTIETTKENERDSQYLSFQEANQAFLSFDQNDNNFEDVNSISFTQPTHESSETNIKRNLSKKEVKKLLQLKHEEPTKLLLSIRKGFLPLLNNRSFQASEIPLVISVLHQALMDKTCPTSKETLLTDLKQTDFLAVSLHKFIVQQIIADRPVLSEKEINLFLNQCICLAESYHSLGPNHLSNFVYLCMDIQEYCSVLENRNLLDQTLRAKLDNLKYSKHIALQKIYEKDQIMMHTDDENPGDFTTISLFPESRDILATNKPNLRPIKVRGAYSNVQHYLDIQFRLMREDYISPLRNGIQAFTSSEEGEHQSSRDVKIYTGVKIKHPVCTFSGMLYKIQFDSRRFKRINWQRSKRLIYGSLLCLSNDGFKTMLIATVAERDTTALKDGIIYVKFETEEAVTITSDVEFVMIESSAYFEAYRHVLIGLQQIKEGIPFERYIVKCETNVTAPKYLKDAADVTYDLSPLIEEEFDINTPHRWNALYNLESGKLQTSKSKLNEKSNTRVYYKNVPILFEELWPSNDSFFLDKSQLTAVKKALTKEFTIIQGPPGTGKTYVGLNIVKTLLHNSKHWIDENHENINKNHETIMVVCYTNHALDQFLEQIQKILKNGILRIGGRSKSKDLQSCLIREFQGMYGKQIVPNAVVTSIHESRFRLQELEKAIDKTAKLLKSADMGVLDENVLLDVIEDINCDHYQNIVLEQSRARNSYIRYNFMVDWLGLNKENFNANETKLNSDQIGEEELIEEDFPETENNEQLCRIIDEGFDLHSKAKTTASKTDRDMEGTGLAIRLLNTSKANEASEDFYYQRDIYIRQELSKTKRMSLERAKSAIDLMNLSTEEKWDLYRLWLYTYKTQVKADSKQQEQEYLQEQKRLVEYKELELFYLMKKAIILGMTTTGAGKYWNVIQRVQPKILVVEEAAEILESHIVTTLSKGCEHLILIGDHKQLRPNPTVHELKKHYHLDISLFERMVHNGLECTTLQYQHRMRPNISALLKPIYSDLKNDPSVHLSFPIPGILKNMFFINHNMPEQSNEEDFSYSNEHEADFIVSLYIHLLKQGYAQAKITILTTYTGQMFLIKKKLRPICGTTPHVTVVDNFQGEENDIILLSLVRSNTEDNIGFIKDENRACVALSRAKHGLYVTGNINMFARKSRLWQRIVDILQKEENIGSALKLCCQRHNKVITVETYHDFVVKSPEGGCNEKCQDRLACGHVCNKCCHILDENHNNYKCEQFVTVKIPHCGHSTDTKCWKRDRPINCQRPCNSILACGHKCANKCGERCNTMCLIQVNKIWPDCGHTKFVSCCIDENTEPCQVQMDKTWPICGHTHVVPCCIDEKIEPCPLDCKDYLNCGHKCMGHCGSCLNGRLHQACTQRCRKILICGHQCEETCGKVCPPCRKACETRCSHSRCTLDCGKVCIPCIELCERQCKHYKCKRLCKDPCDMPPCMEACEKYLKCGHPCIGICGEPCPRWCRICNKEAVEEIFFGSEDDPNAKFVELQDCGHIFEVEAMDTWMNQNSDQTENLAVQYQSCPKCKCPIQKNVRYNRNVNTVLQDLNHLKKRNLRINPDDVRKLHHTITSIKKLDITIGYKLGKKEKYWKDQHDFQFYIFIYTSILKLLRIKTKLLTDINKFRIEKADMLKTYNKPLEQYLNAMIDWCMNTRSVSEQQQDEAMLEVDRLDILSTFLIMFSFGVQLDNIDSQLLDKVLAFIDDLSNIKLSREQQVHYHKELKECSDHIPYTGIGLGISDEERQEIVKAVGLSQGHWYKCPKGHIYAIGECGGAMEKSNCPECGAAIGGQQHTLTDGNQHAPEMDGSRHAAWSDAANNMRNFDLNDIL